MNGYVYLFLGLAWVAWCLPFILAKGSKTPAKLDRRARWGILIQALSFSLLWQGHFWERRPEPWKIAASVLLFGIANLLCWTGTRNLGRQWRLDAGLNEDHKLIRSGPYRFIRHPIYASMLGMLLGTGLITVPRPLLLFAAGIFIAGTEIRIRIEDGLLAARFGEEARAYQRSVPAYIPMVR